MLIALYVSFWLELAAPFSAAVTVAILALPTRGQAMEKAFFRFAATAIGAAASIAIAGAFSQTSFLLLGAFSLWIGLCSYAAGMLDGNRNYAAALCCITVALVAIQDIDSPQQIFSTGTARGAAIVVGIFASALVNDLLAVPDYHPLLSTRIAGIRDRIASYAQISTTEAGATTRIASQLLHDVVEIRPEITSLVTESSSGHARSAAACTAIVELVARIHLIRARASFISSDRLGTLQQDDDVTSLRRLTSQWLQDAISRNSEALERALNALSVGVYPDRSLRAPLYRSHRVALASGIRSALYFAGASIFFVALGWPSTSLCLALVAIMIGFSSTAPDPRSFMIAAMIAAPIACLMGGTIKYGILNGVSQFELLAIGLMPFIVIPAALITLPDRRLALLGRLILIFMIVVFGPSNPQTYDPETFLVTCLFACLSTVVPFIALTAFPPWSSDRRFRQLMDEANDELARTTLTSLRSISFEEALFRDATLIGLIIDSKANSVDAAPLNELMSCFDRTAALRFCNAQLHEIAGELPLDEEISASRTALERRDSHKMVRSAVALLRAADKSGLSVEAACASLVLASIALHGAGTSIVDK